MRKLLLLVIALCLSCGMLLEAFCAENVETSAQAIKNSQLLKTVQEKAAYLIKQAEAFYKSGSFQKAIDTAQYVLSNLDKNSQPAKNLIEKAKAQLKAAAQTAVGNVTNKLFGK